MSISKILKIVSFIVGIFILLLLAFALILPKILDIQIFREQLVQQVKQNSGQDLSIKGDLSLRVFPWIGLRVEDVSLAQPSFIKQDFSPGNDSRESLAMEARNWLQVQEIDVRVKLLPLLKKQLVIKNIRLQKPNIHYIITQDGRTSLDGFIEQSNLNEVESDRVDKNSGQTSVNPGLLIAGVSITQGDILLDDRRSDRKIRLSDVNTEVDNLFSGSFESISFSSQVSVPELPPLKLEIFSNVQVDEKNQRIFLKKSLLKFDINNADQIVELSIKQAYFDQSQKLLEIHKIKAEALIKNLNTTSLRPQLDIETINADLEKGILSPVSFTLKEKALDFDVNGSFSGRSLLVDPVYSGQFISNQISFQNAFENLGIDYQTQDPSALQSLQIEGQFNGDSRTLDFQNIKATVDQSQISGFSFIDFSNNFYRFDLSLDQLNLDRYLAQQPENLSTDPKNSDTSKNKSSDISPIEMLAPITLLQKMSGKGVFRASRFQANGVQLQNINVNVDSSAEAITITPTAQLYQGSLWANLTYYSEGFEKNLSVVGELQNIDLGPLLQDADISDQLLGIGSASTDLSFSEVQGKLTKTGNINLEVLNGAILDTGISEMIAQINNNLLEKCADLRREYFLLVEEIDKRCSEWSSRLQIYENQRSLNRRNRLDFTKGDAKFQLNNSILENQSLIIENDDFYIRGQGEVNTTNQSIDYRASFNLTDFKQGNKNLLFSIPFIARGKLTEIQFIADYNNFLSNLAKEFINLEKSRLKEKLQEELGIDNKQTDNEPKSFEENLEENLKNLILDKLFR